MRRSLVALCLLAFVTPTSAQDFETPTLRGTSPFIPAAPQYTRWAGFYAGGQIGRSSSEMNFAGATESLIAHMLRNTTVEREHHPSTWTVLGKANPSGMSYGAFVGYNVQFSDVILGLDFHYNYSNFFHSAPSTPIGRSVTTEDNVTYNLFVNGNASMLITDYGAARLRAGWLVENFLPFGTLGLAVGRANIMRSASVVGQQITPCDTTANPGCSPIISPLAFSASESKNAHFLYGWSAGGGLDVLLMPNVFLRAEFEYISFAKAQGILAQIGTARVGAGFKF